MTEFTPSEEQKIFFDFVKNDTKNAVISAVAGSGKTTTLIKSLDLLPMNKRTLFMAFNKSIANELKERIPKNKNIEVKTVHGFGYFTIRNYFNPKIEQSKYRKILNDIIISHQKKTNTLIEKYRTNDNLKKLLTSFKKLINFDENNEVNTFKNNVIDLCNLGRLYLIDNVIKVNGINDLKRIAETHTIDTNLNQMTAAWILINIGISYKEEIDYTDMIYLPNVLNLKTETYDYVYVDEIQDLSICQRLLMIKSINPNGGRFFGVGDVSQTIYSFAGSDYESYKKLTEIPNTVQLSLSVTYRCFSNIVDVVKHINPSIKNYEKNIGGEIINDASYTDIKDGDMVLCRHTFPIVSLCLKLLSEGKKSYIIGSDIGLSLKKMILNTKKNGVTFNMNNVLSTLNSEREKLIEKAMSNNHILRSDAINDNYIMSFTEKIKVIDVLSFDLENPDDVIKKIDELFSDSKKMGICLSNIHKSKGLESNRVFIIHKELMPSKYAKLPWQIEQENNLIYVAYTRAKTTLAFVEDFDAFSNNNKRKIEPIIESKHVGTPGMKILLNLMITEIREINTTYGKTHVFEMIDNKGNYFTKFGKIPLDFINDESYEVAVGTNVKFYGLIKDHSEFKGKKTTTLKTITQY